MNLINIIATLAVFANVAGAFRLKNPIEAKILLPEDTENHKYRRCFGAHPCIDLYASASYEVRSPFFTPKQHCYYATAEQAIPVIDVAIADAQAEYNITVINGADNSTIISDRQWLHISTPGHEVDFSDDLTRPYLVKIFGHEAKIVFGPPTDSHLSCLPNLAHYRSPWPESDAIWNVESDQHPHTWLAPASMFKLSFYRPKYENVTFKPIASNMQLLRVLAAICNLPEIQNKSDPTKPIKMGHKWTNIAFLTETLFSYYCSEAQSSVWCVNFGKDIANQPDEYIENKPYGEHKKIYTIIPGRKYARKVREPRKEKLLPKFKPVKYTPFHPDNVTTDFLKYHIGNKYPSWFLVFVNACFYFLSFFNNHNNSDRDSRLHVLGDFTNLPHLADACKGVGGDATLPNQDLRNHDLRHAHGISKPIDIGTP